MNISHIPRRGKRFLPHLQSSSFIGRAALIAFVALFLISSSIPLGHAQQQQQQEQPQEHQMTSQPPAVQNDSAIRTAQSTQDSFRVQIPPGWIIGDLNNTGTVLGAEVLQGYGILAQLCPVEQQEQLQPQTATNSTTAANISDIGTVSSNGTENICQRSQDQVIHIVRYPNIGAGMGLGSDNTTGNNSNSLTPDAILAYEMQKLQAAGYRDIRIVNSTDTTVNLDLSTGLNNSKMSAGLPAKLVEMTYSTNLAPNQTKTGYFLTTATGATSPDLNTLTGYAVFYEGGQTSPEAVAEEDELKPTIMRSGNLVLEPLTPVRQVFSSFELIARPEVAQAIIAAQTAQTTQTTEGQMPMNPLAVEIDSNSTEDKAPVTVEYEADIAHGTKPYTISWDLNNDGVAEGNEQTFTVFYPVADTYDLALTVTDAMGRIATDNIEVRIEEGDESSSDSDSNSDSDSDSESQAEGATTDETPCDPSHEIGCESEDGSESQPPSYGERDNARDNDLPTVTGIIDRAIDTLYVPRSP